MDRFLHRQPGHSCPYMNREGDCTWPEHYARVQERKARTGVPRPAVQ
jgi:hypothetical protein